jgi:predicted phage terminase large subunit-like protein
MTGADTPHALDDHVAHAWRLQVPGMPLTPGWRGGISTDRRPTTSPKQPMPITTKLRLHSEGPALWPEHKPLEEVLDLKATTPDAIWESTYNGNPTPPGGAVFMKAWWDGKNRYDANDPALMRQVVARWITWDTAQKDKVDNDYTAACVLELLPDYRLVVREVYRAKLTFPELPEAIEHLARRYAYDERLRGVIIEDKGSGTSAYQTLAQAEDAWLRAMLVPFLPRTSKEERAKQAAVWCKLDCVLLPTPSDVVPWLFDFSDEIFTFPGGVNDDQADSFVMGVLYLERLLSEGWRARQGLE